MKRLDPSVNNLSVIDLEENLFQGTWQPLDLDKILEDKNQHYEYHKLVALLQEFPIGKRKVCLVNPFQIKPDLADLTTIKNKRYQDFPPIGLMYLSSAIRSFAPSWDVDIVDLHLETLKRTLNGEAHDFESIMQSIADDYDLYGVSMMFEAWEPMVVRVLEYLQNRGNLMIVGGVHGSVTYGNLLGLDLCDIVIKKEGEPQLVKLLNMWENVHSADFQLNGKYQEINNLSFKYQEEVVSFQDKFENPVALDLRKEWELIDLDSYNKHGAPNIWARIQKPIRKWSIMIASRGCRGKCTFCQVSQIMGMGVRTRSASDIVDEILFLYHNQDVRHIEFVDDDLLGNKDRTLEWLKLIAKQKLDITFSVGSGVLAIQIDEEVAQALDDANFIMAGFGVETGNEERLKTLKKPTNLKKVADGVEIFTSNHRHIWLQVNFIVGFPSETYRELMDTFNFAKNLEVDFCQSSILRPIISTPIYDELADINDERIERLDKFGSEKKTADTAGKDIVSRGYTFDDMFDEVIDFRTVDLDSIPGPMELQQFQIYFNTSINLIGSVNLKPGGMPEKIMDFTEDVLKAYPMDAVSWAVNAKAASLCGDENRYNFSLKNCKKAVKNSRYWSEYFEVYDVPGELGLPL